MLFLNKKYRNSLCYNSILKNGDFYLVNMVGPCAVGRRMERLIGSDAYNNTERYQQKIREQNQPILTSENSIPIGGSEVNPETGKVEFIRYIKDESGNIINPMTNEIVRKSKDISKKLKEQ